MPPDPPLDLGGLYGHLDRANQALGRLDGLTTLLPDTRLFLYLYIRKEALLSSQIEGTKSSFSDLLLFENEAVPGVPIDDVEEVSNYVAAMQHGLRRIKGGFPISLRLIREIHAILLRGGRGANKTRASCSQTSGCILGVIQREEPRKQKTRSWAQELARSRAQEKERQKWRIGADNSIRLSGK